MGRETGCVQGLIKLGLDDSFRMFVQQELQRCLLSPDPPCSPAVCARMVDVFQQCWSHLQEKAHGTAKVPMKARVLF